jgi:hypothetical protein
VHELLAARNFARDTRVLTPAYCARKGWQLIRCDFPILDVVLPGNGGLRLQLACDDWDEQPPAITLLQQDGAPRPVPVSGGVFNASAHPTAGRPFICMRGTREYHTHPSHVNESWASYRGQDGMDLVGLITQLDSAWQKARAA